MKKLFLFLILCSLVYVPLCFAQEKTVTIQVKPQTVGTNIEVRDDGAMINKNTGLATYDSKTLESGKQYNVTKPVPDKSWLGKEMHYTVTKGYQGDWAIRTEVGGKRTEYIVKGSKGEVSLPTAIKAARQAWNNEEKDVTIPGDENIKDYSVPKEGDNSVSVYQSDGKETVGGPLIGPKPEIPAPDLSQKEMSPRTQEKLEPAQSESDLDKTMGTDEKVGMNAPEPDLDNNPMQARGGFSQQPQVTMHEEERKTND